MVERSRPYLHHIVEELEARGMPTELALLPMVESSFNPNAYFAPTPRALWQFIPATGKRFNLEQNWWRDERRDIVASTNAALDYLQTIYDMHGDWHLALASYNWGEGAVKRAIVKNESRGLPTDYPSLNMPNETRHYVPKLQALKNIFGNAALISRLGLPFISNEPYFATLESPRPIDVKPLPTWPTCRSRNSSASIRPTTGRSSRRTPRSSFPPTRWTASAANCTTAGCRSPSGRPIRSLRRTPGADCGPLQHDLQPNSPGSMGCPRRFASVPAQPCWCLVMAAPRG